MNLIHAKLLIDRSQSLFLFVPEENLTAKQARLNRRRGWLGIDMKWQGTKKILDRILLTNES